MLVSAAILPSPPRTLFLPISLEIMSDPVTLVGDGMTYECSSIERWLAAGNTTSPVTNAKLGETPKDLNFVRVQFVWNSIRAWGTCVSRLTL